MNTNSRFQGVRIFLIVLTALFGLHFMPAGGLPAVAAAPAPAASAMGSNDHVEAAAVPVEKLVVQQVQDAVGNVVMYAAPLFGPFLGDPQKAVAEADLPSMIETLLPLSRAPAEVDKDNIVSVKPTQAALDVNTPKTVFVVAGTGGGADASGVVQGDTTYLMTPYPGTVISWLPAPLGPVDYGPSVDQAAAQAVANAKVNPQAENPFQGFSQGASAASDAGALDGQPSHIIGYGSPDNPGTGFRSAMPAQLGPINIGTPAELQSEDRMDLYSQSGDCWTNFPAIWRVMSLIACIPATGDTHYGKPGYGDFHEDEVYESAPGINQHVDWTENGLVIGAEDWLHLDLTEDQKQFLRDIAPQGRPGIQEGPTLREIVEDPAAAVASTVDALVKAVPGLADMTPQADSIPQADAIPLEMPLEGEQFLPAVQASIDQAEAFANDLANSTGDPVVQDFVGNAVEQFDTFVDNAFNGGGNTVQNDYVAPANTDQGAYEAPVFTAPVGDLSNVVNQFNDIVGQFNGLLAGAH